VTFALNPVTLTTPYPAIEVAPGARVSLTVEVETEDPGRVDLSINGVPADWTATLRGGGFLVNGVQSNGTDATEVTLDVTVPETAAEGEQRITLEALSDGSTASLPVDITVTPNAAGEVTLTTDFPELQGTTDATFSFTLTLTNSTPDDLTFGATASGPPGWTVDAKVTSQAQAASAIVEAGSSTSIEVTAEAPQDAPASVYPITVQATSALGRDHRQLRSDAHDARRAIERERLGWRADGPVARPAERRDRGCPRRDAVRIHPDRLDRDIRTRDRDGSCPGRGPGHGPPHAIRQRHRW
jgi:uncharacterized membrane protein